MKSELKFILLLLLALLLVLAYSFLPEESPLVKFLHAKQMDVSAFVLHPSDTTATEHAITELQQPVFGDKPDSVHVRALLFGDSMVEFLRNSLANYLNANGMESSSVVWYSSTTQLWAEMGTLEYFLEKTQPTHIFIALGSNQLYSNKVAEMRKASHNIISRCGNRPVIWIGPPNWCEDKGINQVIQEVMGDRAYFCSKDLELPRGSDHHHPTQKGADIWMDSIAAWINQGHTVFPYRLKTPETYDRSSTNFSLKPYRPGDDKKEDEKREPDTKHKTPTEPSSSPTAPASSPESQAQDSV